jgi:hypothetical protein
MPVSRAVTGRTALSVVASGLALSPKSARLALAPGAITCALALAGCGAGGSGSLAGSRSHSSFLKFSECMRAHGVSNFPDPGPGGGIILPAGPSSGLDPQSPAFQTAQQSCKPLLPGGGPPAQLPESARLESLRFAQCMRAHGVSSFPDPRFRGGGRIQQRLPNGVDPASPVFQSAQKACGGSGLGAVAVGPG